MFVANPELRAMADVEIVSVEDCSSGTCMPPSHHMDICTNQTSGDSYCGNLGEGAALCAQVHDAKNWEFTSCLLANNGYPGSTGGIAVDAEFEGTVKQCAADTLDSYAFDDLKACYTGAEGDALRHDAYTKSSAKRIMHPTWLYVAGDLVSVAGPPNPTADLTEWANDVKTAICAAYTEDLPGACSAAHVQV